MADFYFDVVFRVTSHNLFSDTACRLIAALPIGTAMGMERSLNRKVAGLKTHGLISIASAIASLCGPVLAYSMNMPGDASRLAGQILTGIGFVGAGVIVKKGPYALGVTTAASIFLSACLGIACGLGFPLLSLLVIILMSVYSKVVRWIAPNDELACTRLVTLRVKVNEVNRLRQSLPQSARLKSFRRLEDDREIVLALKMMGWDEVDRVIDNVVKNFDVSVLDTDTT